MPLFHTFLLYNFLVAWMIQKYAFHSNTILKQIFCRLFLWNIFVVSLIWSCFKYKRVTIKTDDEKLEDFLVLIYSRWCKMMKKVHGHCVNDGWNVYRNTHSHDCKLQTTNNDFSKAINKNHKWIARENNLSQRNWRLICHSAWTWNKYVFNSVVVGCFATRNNVITIYSNDFNLNFYQLNTFFNVCFWKMIFSDFRIKTFILSFLHEFRFNLYNLWKL